MKKLVVFLLVFALAGCVNNYKPKLRSEPSDIVVYDKDRHACIEQIKTELTDAYFSSENMAKNAPKTALFGAFGAAGGLARAAYDDANADPNAAKPKTEYQMIDDCLIAKGYPVDSN